MSVNRTGSAVTGIAALEVAAETAKQPFRHKIGDALYDLIYHEQPVREGGPCEETVMYTIVKRTEGYVYVRTYHDPTPECPFAPKWRDDEGLVRLSVDELERTGRAWNGRHRMSLHTRPMPHWPVLLVSSVTAKVAAIEGRTA